MGPGLFAGEGFAAHFAQGAQCLAAARIAAALDAEAGLDQRFGDPVAIFMGDRQTADRRRVGEVRQDHGETVRIASGRKGAPGSGRDRGDFRASTRASIGGWCDQRAGHGGRTARGGRRIVCQQVVDGGDIDILPDCFHGAFKPFSVHFQALGKIVLQGAIPVFPGHDPPFPDRRCVRQDGLLPRRHGADVELVIAFQCGRHDLRGFHRIELDGERRFRAAGREAGAQRAGQHRIGGFHGNILGQRLDGDFQEIGLVDHHFIWRLMGHAAGIEIPCARLDQFAERFFPDAAVSEIEIIILRRHVVHVPDAQAGLRHADFKAVPAAGNLHGDPLKRGGEVIAHRDAGGFQLAVHADFVEHFADQADRVRIFQFGLAMGIVAGPGGGGRSHIHC